MLFDMKQQLLTIISIFCLLTPNILQGSGGGCGGDARFDYCESLRGLGVQFQFQGYNFLGWDFGDGMFDWENESPYHVFEEEGYYYVCAMGGGSYDSGYCWRTECEFIEVKHNTSTEILEGDINYVAEGNQFHFETTANLEGIIGHWSFGNEGISSELNPMHIFEEPGKHEVVFTTIDEENCTEKSITKEIELPSDLGVCEVRFDFEIEENKVEFTSKNIGYPTQVLWDFGDGETSTDLNPHHIFGDTRTSKEVCLTITDDYQGCEKTHCRTVDFEKKGLCKAKFEVIPLQDSLFYFLNDVSEFEGEIVHKKYFDKNNYYENGRMYYHVPNLLFRSNPIYSLYREICLEIELESGIKDVHCETIFFPKSRGANNFAGYFTAEVNQNEFCFDSAGYGVYEWNYGDGTVDTTGCHQYGQTGIYQVCMNLKDSSPSLAYCRLVDVYSENESKAFFHVWETGSYYEFNFEDHSVASQNREIVKWNWDFGDETYSIEQNPSHVFSEPNMHQVCLTTEDNLGRISTYCKEISIEGCDADFIIENLNGVEERCIQYGRTYLLKDNSFSSSSIAERYWTVRHITPWDEEDIIDTLSNEPTFEYTAQSDEEVSLSIVNDSECINTYARRTGWGCDCGFYYWIGTNHYNPTDKATGGGTFFHDYSEMENRYAFFLYPHFFEDWTWIFEDGTTSKAAKLTKQFDTNGYHKICLKATQHGRTCTECRHVEGKDFVYVEESEVTTIEKLEEDLVWKVFPNPSRNYLNIDLPSDRQIFQKLLIQDWQGKVVYQQTNVERGLLQINTNLFPKGLYFVNLITDEGISSKKFLKVEE